MSEDGRLLTSREMASFVALGFLRLDRAVPASVNRAFVQSLPPFEAGGPHAGMTHYGQVLQSGSIPTVSPGCPLAEAYSPGSPLAEVLSVPEVRGAIGSLVGRDPVVDHQFLHMTFPEETSLDGRRRSVSQATHQDSTIDVRRAFDIQILYFPEAVTPEMGGTRYVPGSHLRTVSESSIGRYQNLRGQRHVVCEPGTVFLFHHGLWHGAGLNQSDARRLMFKLRLAPTARQRRLWDTSDLEPDHHRQRPIFWTGDGTDRDPIHEILTRLEPWFELDTGRLEILNRIRLWRYLLEDERLDVDYWLSRLENEYR
ncbi:MAG: phytanoyl-CoA dioxygenase family protein [Candidatus Binatia bacterium]|nr:phytanoyl-CoA dioxygenase family protein [Candidatus Binatia bacterium]MDG2010920.1 phytanoyl-CoA dioxygenase family protein [Candidatus Binatia bacterium]